MLFLYNDIAHRFELLVPRSHPFVTPWHFPCQGNLCLRRQKRSHDVRFFVSVGTSAQFSRLRHRIAVTERGCYLSQTKQSGELFCRRDTMRQRQLPTTYLKSQVRAARTSQSPFCHFVTFPLSGESLFEAPNKKSWKPWYTRVSGLFSFCLGSVKRVKII